MTKVGRISYMYMAVWKSGPKPYPFPPGETYINTNEIHMA